MSRLNPSQSWGVRREAETKVEAETDPKYGYDPQKRPINLHMRFGMVNLDKPSGPTSHEVVAWIKKFLKVEHAGHGGTLEAI